MAFRMRWPVEGKIISQPFGANPEFYFRIAKLPGHEGIDFDVRPNSKIFAVADGIVSRINLDGDTDRSRFPYGNQVRLTHTLPEGEFTSIYAHLNEVLVGLGEKVRAGQLIARSGNTGNTTGPHLHLTLKRKGASTARMTNYPNDIIDPSPFLDPFGTVYPETATTTTTITTTIVRESATNVENVDLSTNTGVTPQRAAPGTTNAVTTPATGAALSQLLPDNLRFLADVSIPDNSVIGAGMSFIKTWRVTNNGTTTWGEGYTLTFFKDEQMTGVQKFPMPSARPGQTIEVSVMLTAPNRAGRFRSVWKAQNPTGTFFGMALFAVIVVQ